MRLSREGSTVKKMIRMLGIGGAVLGTVLPIGAARADTAPHCGIRWGSFAKAGSAAATRATAVPVALTNVRAGRHACFDRLVLDGASWARVRYVGQVREDGSGRVVPLRGGARL